jgi:excinuclease ABC subunit B
MSRPQLEKAIEHTKLLMAEASRNLEFIEAAQYRDELYKLQDRLQSLPETSN